MDFTPCRLLCILREHKYLSNQWVHIAEDMVQFYWENISDFRMISFLVLVYSTGQTLRLVVTIYNLLQVSYCTVCKEYTIFSFHFEAVLETELDSGTSDGHCFPNRLCNSLYIRFTACVFKLQGRIVSYRHHLLII